MLLEKLIRRHPLHQKHAHYWELLTKLVAGGSKVDKEVKEELLINPDKRPQQVIDRRLELAPYLSFMGGILTKLEAQLLAKEATYENPDMEADSFWKDEFFAMGGLNELGAIPFHQFLKDAAIAALTQQVAIAVIDTPYVEAENQVQQATLGGDKPYVYLKPRESMWDWDMDSKGFNFVKFHDYRQTRQGWDSSPVPEHTFTIYQKIEGMVYFQVFKVVPKDVSRFENSYFDIENVAEDDVIIIEEKPLTEVFNVAEGGSSIFKFPVVTLKLDPSLWLADQLYDPQVSLFNQSSAGEWALFSTNYAQLTFKGVEDIDELNERVQTTTGDGYYWGLPPGVEPLWLERSGQGIDRAFAFVKDRKEEMLEIVQQVSYSAAMSYAGLQRSGISKQEDRRNLDILLEVYAQVIKTFAKGVLDVCSIARGSNSVWTVDGLNNYDSDSLLQDLEQYTKSEQVINSPTFRTAAQQKIASLAMSDLGLEKDIQQDVLAEIGSNSFYLEEHQLEALETAVSTGRLSTRSYLETLKKLQILPDDFSVDQEMQRLGIEVVDLQNTNGDTVLS